MPKERQDRHLLISCMDCNQDFIIRANKGREPSRFFCPFCGDNVATKRERTVSSKLFHNRKRAWTEEEDRALLYGRKRGTPYKEIAAVLPGRSERACRYRHSILSRRKEGEAIV